MVVVQVQNAALKITRGGNFSSQAEDVVARRKTQDGISAPVIGASRLARDIVNARLPVGRIFVNLSSGYFRVVDIPRGSYTLRAVQYQADPPQWLAAEEPVMVSCSRNIRAPTCAI
jgi:hypothetical protein